MSYGAHIYIDVTNLNGIILKEEKNNDNLKRVVHMMHNFHSAITELSQNYPNCEVEKLTAGRIHIVMKSGVKEFTSNLLDFCYSALYINNNYFNNLSKYKNLPNLQISIGVDIGTYYTHKHMNGNELEEITTIGYPANYAAKIQSITKINNLSIPEKMYNDLDFEVKEIFTKYSLMEVQSISKTHSFTNFYYTNYGKMKSNLQFDLEGIKNSITDRHNAVDFKQISFEDAKAKLNFSNLSIKKNKQFEATVLYADVNGFTKLFKEDGSNSANMLKAVRKLLNEMAKKVKKHDGVRVQFQGDRISAVFHDHRDYKEDLLIDTIVCGMDIIEAVKNLNEQQEFKELINYGEISVGVGISKGEIVATRTGLKNNKDHLILGNIVKDADDCEAKYASCNEIVITTLHFRSLKSTIKHKAMKELFTKISGTEKYKTTARYEDYCKKKNELFEDNVFIKQQKEKTVWPYLKL